MFEALEEESIVLCYLTAKIRTLQGRCHLESGLLSEARKKLNEAMNSLGYHFPRHNFSINLKSMIQLEFLRWKLICPKPWKMDVADELTMNYIEQLAICLALMFEVFRVKSCFTPQRYLNFNRLFLATRVKLLNNHFAFITLLLLAILKLFLQKWILCDKIIQQWMFTGNNGNEETCTISSHMELECCAKFIERFYHALHFAHEHDAYRACLSKKVSQQR